MEELDFHISQIASILGLAKPVGFMLSYELGDIWIDVYLEKVGEGWTGRTYTISVPKEKASKLRLIVESVGGSSEDVLSDSERAYASLSYEDWEQAGSALMNLL
ncbi:MAG: hypothetical protein D6674_06485 [Acidobacteria bacterium]|jgi:hypothetical protein|nr:MAG: hypothetical protein D6674_06485 [Acidobacteriota bacterium]